MGLGGVAMAQDKPISIYFVGCAAPTGFHGHRARGAEEAGANLGVKVTYVFPDRLIIPNQVQKIEEAIAAQADGIAVCAFAEDFDAYGTLFDLASAVTRCPEVLEPQRAALSALWRDKQLQYMWLRALQGCYVDFWQVTGDSLDFSLESLGLELPGLRDRLMDLYRTLAAFPEVPGVLQALRAAGFRTAILSNGSPAMLESAVAAAGLEGLLDAVLSADAVATFKTDHRVYQHALDVLGVPAASVSFQSSNAWDAHGAADFGLQVVWCNRYGQRRERLPGKPDHEIRTLAELPALLAPPA